MRHVEALGRAAARLRVGQPFLLGPNGAANWEADGTTETLNDLLRRQVRLTKGRVAAATAAICDSQSVKTSCNVSETSQGIDAGKKIKGRKRHIAADALGLLLVAIVTAASVQDSAGGQQVLDHLADEHPSVSTVWVDGGYNNTVIRRGAQHSIRVGVVKRPTTKGFHVLPRATSASGRTARWSSSSNPNATYLFDLASAVGRLQEVRTVGGWAITPTAIGMVTPSINVAFHCHWT